MRATISIVYTKNAFIIAIFLSLNEIRPPHVRHPLMFQQIVFDYSHGNTWVGEAPTAGLTDKVERLGELRDVEKNEG